MGDDLLSPELDSEVRRRLGIRMPDDLSDMVNEFKEELKMAYQPKGGVPDLSRIVPPGYVKPDENLVFQLRTGCTHELQYVKVSDGTHMKVCIECDIAEEIDAPVDFKLEGPGGSITFSSQTSSTGPR